MKTNAKRIVLFIVIPFMLAGLPLRGKEKKGFGISLRLSGSLIDVANDEARDGALGNYNFWEAAAIADGYTTVGYQGDVPGKCTWLGEAELILHFNRYVGLGIGGGYLWRSIPFEFTATKASHTGRLDLLVENSAIPLTASIYLTLPVTRWLAVTLRGGIGYYLGRYDSDFRISEDSDWMRTVASADANAIGYHGGVGLEFSLGRTFRFFAEAQYRQVEINDFTGSAEFSENGGFSSSYDGRLYSFDINEGGQLYHVIELDPTTPSGSTISNVSEATIGFGGLTLTAGVRIRF